MNNTGIVLNCKKQHTKAPRFVNFFLVRQGNKRGGQENPNFINNSAYFWNDKTMAGHIGVFVSILFFGSFSAIPESDFYPFGLASGDTELAANDDGSTPEVTVSTLFPFFSRQHGSLWVISNCFIFLSLY